MKVGLSFTILCLTPARLRCSDAVPHVWVRSLKTYIIIQSLTAVLTKISSTLPPLVGNLFRISSLPYPPQCSPITTSTKYLGGPMHMPETPGRAHPHLHGVFQDD
jgi:hypothetical protein